jgi:hypothetical protein
MDEVRHGGNRYINYSDWPPRARMWKTGSGSFSMKMIHWQYQRAAQDFSPGVRLRIAGL